jgi:two-component system NtrC family response regulator
MALSPVTAPIEGTFTTLREIRENTERKAVIRALALTDNNMSRAAQILGVCRPTLYGLIKSLNVDRGGQ